MVTLIKRRKYCPLREFQYQEPLNILDNLHKLFRSLYNLIIIIIIVIVVILYVRLHMILIEMPRPPNTVS